MIFIHFEPAQLVQLLASTVFPLLVALVTQRDTHAGRRAVLLALLAGATTLASALATALQTGAPFDLLAALAQFVLSFLVAVGMHFGAWKPSGLAAVLQSVGSPAPGAALPAETDLDGILGRAAAPRHAAIPGTVLTVTSDPRERGNPGVLYDPDAPAPGVKQDLTAAEDPAPIE